MQFLAIALIALSMTLISCGGGGSGRRTNFGNAVRCTDNYTPEFAVAEDSKNQKVSWPDGVNQDAVLPVGEYKYGEMEFFISNEQNGLKIHVKDTLAHNGEIIGTVVCARNMGGPDKKMTASLSLPAISKVEASGKTAYETRNLIISYTDKLTVTTEKIAGSDADAPSKVADDQNLDSQLYQAKGKDVKDGTYELYVTGQEGPIKKFGIVRFIKKP